MTYKLGKREAIPDERTLRLGKYLDVAAVLPKAPRIFGFGTMFSNWGMLGNDYYGDCVLAAGGHETMLWTTVLGGPGVTITASNALSDYSAITGFSKTDPNSDQGTYVIDAMKYRQKTGLVDKSGARHKIAAYVSIDPKDWSQLIVAAFVFGVAEIGFEFPDYAMTQFNEGEFWSVETGGQIEGGHDVCFVGSRNSDNRLTAITWGRRQQMTRDFYEQYNDETWVPLSQEMIRSDGKGLHGFDLATFKADLAAL